MIKQSLLAGITVICLLFSLTVKAKLTEAESQIRAYLQQQKQAQIALLQKLVDINSGTSNLAGVRKVGDILKNEFDALGFTTRWVEEPPSMSRAGTLIAEHKGSQGKRLLLIGHLDTVFASDNPFQKFTTDKAQNTATGPGVIDDKGGDVVILFALKALKAANALDNHSITVVLTGDEEDSGKPTSISRKPLKEIASSVDVALDFESAIPGTAIVSRRGVSNWLIEIAAEGGHGSQIFNPLGAGAIYEAARIVEAMRSYVREEKFLTLNAGLIFGGTTVHYDRDAAEGCASGKSNVIPKVSLVKGDMRFLTAQQKQRAEQQLTTIMAKHLPGTESKITFRDGIPAMPPTANNLKLLEQYNNVSQELGYGTIKPLDPILRGAADMSHISAIVPANLAGLGALGSGEHSDKETVDLRYLPFQTELAAVLMYRLTTPH